ncbi:uncharacterized protein LOC102804626 [Saccoglossus kowalevskii]
MIVICLLGLFLLFCAFFLIHTCYFECFNDPLRKEPEMPLPCHNKIPFVIPAIVIDEVSTGTTKEPETRGTNHNEHTKEEDDHHWSKLFPPTHGIATQSQPVPEPVLVVDLHQLTRVLCDTKDGQNFHVNIRNISDSTTHYNKQFTIVANEYQILYELNRGNVSILQIHVKSKDYCVTIETEDEYISKL